MMQELYQNKLQVPKLRDVERGGQRGGGRYVQRFEEALE